jgi:hypothetical protein
LIEELTNISKEYFEISNNYDPEERYNKGTVKYTYQLHGITPLYIKRYVGISMYFGLVNLPKKAYYWSDKVLYKNFVSKSISRDNYHMINLAFHVCPVDDDQKHDHQI